MKTLFAAILLSASFPANAYESIGDRGNQHIYQFQRGYAHENKCFRYEYREEYVPGTSISPGYVKSHHEKILVSCNSYGNALKHNNYHKEQLPSYVKYKSDPKCAGSTTLGGLIGGGIAASLSHSNAYSWSIPLGAILGAGIGNAGCE